MLSDKMARRIGINACIDKLGREFVLAHQDNATSTYGKTEEGMYCYVGVSDIPLPEYEPGVLVLDSMPSPYHASCIVNLENGALTFKEVVRPAIQ